MGGPVGPGRSGAHLMADPIHAGDVYCVALPNGTGSELQGPHYAVVASDGAYNDLSTVVVVPFSSWARRYSWRVPTTIRGARTVVLIDQIRVVDKSVLREQVGVLPDTALLAVRTALVDLLGLANLHVF